MIVMLLQQNLSKQSADEKAETVRRKYLALTPMESLVPTTEMMQWLLLVCQIVYICFFITRLVANSWNADWGDKGLTLLIINFLQHSF